MTSDLEEAALDEQYGEGSRVGIRKLLQSSGRKTARLQCATPCRINPTRYRDAWQDGAADIAGERRVFR